MSTFADQLKAFQVKIEKAVPDVVIGVTTELHRSITEGSPLTGAPGQPVDTGYLKNSWQYEIRPDGSGSTIGTNAAYAPVIEYGTRSAYDPKGRLPENDGTTLRKPIKSTVGGVGSVRLTVANADRIQAEVVRDLTKP